MNKNIVTLFSTLLLSTSVYAYNTEQQNSHASDAFSSFSECDPDFEVCEKPTKRGTPVSKSHKVEKKVLSGVSAHSQKIHSDAALKSLDECDPDFEVCKKEIVIKEVVKIEKKELPKKIVKKEVVKIEKKELPKKIVKKEPIKKEVPKVVKIVPIVEEPVENKIVEIATPQEPQSKVSSSISVTQMFMIGLFSMLLLLGWRKMRK